MLFPSYFLSSWDEELTSTPLARASSDFVRAKGIQSPLSDFSGISAALLSCLTAATMPSPMVSAAKVLDLSSNFDCRYLRTEACHPPYLFAMHSCTPVTYMYTPFRFHATIESGHRSIKKCCVLIATRTACKIPSLNAARSRVGLWHKKGSTPCELGFPGDWGHYGGGGWGRKGARQVLKERAARFTFTGGPETWPFFCFLTWVSLEIIFTSLSRSLSM